MDSLDPTPVVDEVNGNAGSESGATIEQEIDRLRQRFSVIEDIDARTSEMVNRLSDVLRSSAEARAQATIEISTAIGKLRDLRYSERATERASLLGMLDDLNGVTGRATELREAVEALGERIIDIGRRIDGDDCGAGISENTPDAVSQTADLLEGPTTTAITVSRIPSAAVALSIQRFSAGLPGVSATITRSYQQGELRLELQSDRSRKVAEFDDWPDGELSRVAEGQNHLEFEFIPLGKAPDTT